MRSRYKILDTNRSFFITSTIQNWIPIFTSERYFNHLIEAIKYNQENKDLEIFAYVIMPNHFHMICRSEKLSNVISSIKSYSAKNIIKELETDKKFELLKLFEDIKMKHKTDRKYQIWQEGFHPQEIMSDKIFYQKIEYIHYNPIRNNLVDDYLDWRYSSAIDFYTGKEGAIKLDLFDYDI